MTAGIKMKTEAALPKKSAKLVRNLYILLREYMRTIVKTLSQISFFQ